MIAFLFQAFRVFEAFAKSRSSIHDVLPIQGGTPMNDGAVQPHLLI